MPRRKRIWTPDYYYHIADRGNRRDPLFQNTTDFQAFFRILQRLHEEIPFEITSYCLMTNHYHLQLRSPEIPLPKLMSYLNKRYANYYNTRYHLTGHVFEKRYYDKMIVDPVGMYEVSRYIHWNPVEANIVSRPEDYPWSSYHLFKNPNAVPPSFIKMEHLLNIFEGTAEERKVKYCKSVELEGRGAGLSK